MYNDFYLKFTDEAEARSVLYRIEGAVEADPENGIEAVEGYEVPNFRNIDTIGTITEGGEYDEEGNVLVEPTVLEGFHVNVRATSDEDTTPLEPFAVQPTSPLRSSPLRVWG